MIAVVFGHQVACIMRLHPTVASGFVLNGWYVAAIVVEDFPKTAITVGGKTHLTSQPLSSVPLQVTYINFKLISLLLPVMVSSMMVIIYVTRLFALIKISCYMSLQQEFSLCESA